MSTLSSDAACATPACPRGILSEDEIGALVGQLRAAADVDGGAGFPDGPLSELATLLVQVCGAKFDAGARPKVLGDGGAVSATAVLVTVSAMMKASNLEIFELGMWQSWSGTR
ncbi:hypothetical protein [Xanthobacter sp. KR7-225]|uniref:hypothetical protein n=1 Tax=Xanthobacter sp. KR7-225 TaxID=3156613 RepID=UPI0032B3B5DA